MDLFISLIFFTLFFCFRGSSGATFTFVNNCDYTIWPGILANSGSPTLESTGFVLDQASSRSFQAPTGWSGRFWARTACNFDGSGQYTCATGDCGSGQVECNGAGAAPPATLAEFTLGSGTQDFYDVSLVDGYNLPMVVETTGGSGPCAATGCVTDLNLQCPAELRVGNQAQGCKSACEAFGSPEYCCSGAYATPDTCKPSAYSAMFKSACPRSYSYAYDDATSTFTCTGASYIITFCPSYANSQKSSTDKTPRTTTDGGTNDGATGGGSQAEESGNGIESGTGTGTGTATSSSTGSSSSSEGSEAMLADSSWIAGLAAGGSTISASTRSIDAILRSTLISIATTSVILMLEALA